MWIYKGKGQSRMSKIYALYNPLAGQKAFKKEEIASNMVSEEIIFLDITSLDYPAFSAGSNSNGDHN